MNKQYTYFRLPDSLSYRYAIFEISLTLLLQKNVCLYSVRAVYYSYLKLNSTY